MFQVGAVQSTNSPESTTPWGDPNLQGLWDFRTITPLERPDDLVGQAELTQEEALNFSGSGPSLRIATDGMVPEVLK